MKFKYNGALVSEKKYRKNCLGCMADVSGTFKEGEWTTLKPWGSKCMKVSIKPIATEQFEVSFDNVRGIATKSQSNRTYVFVETYIEHEKPIKKIDYDNLKYEIRLEL
jgi:hypothetical protein